MFGAVLSGWVEVYPAARVGAYIELRGGASANNRILLKLLRRIVLDGLAGLRIDAFGPIQVFDVLSSADEGAISAVQRVIKSVAGEMAQHLAWLTVDRDVVQHLRADFVIIVLVVRCVLKIPDDLAGIGVDRERRIGVQIVARAILGVEHGGRLTRAPIHQICGCIICTGIPEGAAAGLPRVVVVCPGLVTGFTRRRDRVGTPQYLTGFGVDCHQPASPAYISTGSRYDYHVLNDERRTREHIRVSNLIILVPKDLA